MEYCSHNHITKDNRITNMFWSKKQNKQTKKQTDENSGIQRSTQRNKLGGQRVTLRYTNVY